MLFRSAIRPNRSLLGRLWEMGATSQSSGRAATAPTSKAQSRRKTKFCKFNFQGVCKYSAENCIYAHSLEEMHFADGGTFRKAQSAESAEVVVTTATDAESQEGCGTAKGMNILPACLPGPMMLPPGLVRVAPRAPPSDDCLAPAAATPATPAPLPWPPPAPAPSGPALPGEEGPSGASLLEVAQLYQALAGLRMELTAVADLLRAIEVAKADVQQMVSQAGLRFGDGEQAGVWPAPAPFRCRYVAPQVGWQVPSASWSDGVQLP